MGIYKKEIEQLEDSLAVLEEGKMQLQEEIDALIDQIDEVHQSIEILKNREDGMKNGFDELVEQTDWTNPDN